MRNYELQLEEYFWLHTLLIAWHSFPLFCNKRKNNHFKFFISFICFNWIVHKLQWNESIAVVLKYTNTHRFCWWCEREMTFCSMLCCCCCKMYWYCLLLWSGISQNVVRYFIRACLQNSKSINKIGFIPSAVCSALDLILEKSWREENFTEIYCDSNAIQMNVISYY